MYFLLKVMCVQYAKMVNYNKQKQSNGILIDTERNQPSIKTLMPTINNRGQTVLFPVQKNYLVQIPCKYHTLHCTKNGRISCYSQER